MSTDMTVAATILAQLGGNRFKAMTGAKDFVSDGTYLQFRLSGRTTKDSINLVIVTLENDLYTLQFSRIRGVNVIEIARREHIYAENLQMVFTLYTGLDTHL